MIELLLQAERALAMGLVDHAERLYLQALAADPLNSIAVVGLARVALERADDAEAYRRAKQALKIDPENVAAVRLAERLEEVNAPRGQALPTFAPSATTRPALTPTPAPIPTPAPTPIAPSPITPLASAAGPTTVAQSTDSHIIKRAPTRESVDMLAPTGNNPAVQPTPATPSMPVRVPPAVAPTPPHVAPASPPVAPAASFPTTPSATPTPRSLVDRLVDRLLRRKHP